MPKPKPQPDPHTLEQLVKRANEIAEQSERNAKESRQFIKQIEAMKKRGKGKD